MAYFTCSTFSTITTGKLQVLWKPYTTDLIAHLPTICQADEEIWRTMLPLICFDIIEWHRPERVLRQFGK